MNTKDNLVFSYNLRTCFRQHQRQFWAFICVYANVNSNVVVSDSNLSTSHRHSVVHFHPWPSVFNEPYVHFHQYQCLLCLKWTQSSYFYQQCRARNEVSRQVLSTSTSNKRSKFLQKKKVWALAASEATANAFFCKQEGWPNRVFTDWWEGGG